MTANTAPLFFVEIDYGKLGKSFRETDRNTSSRDQVVADILSGELDCVIKVLEIFEDEGTCRDVTEDIAQLVFEKAEIVADDEGEPSFGHLQDFLEEHFGFMPVQRELAEAVS